MRSIGLDFDGVIRLYDAEPADGSVFGTPVDYAFAAVEELLKDWYVFIFSVRDPYTVSEWLSQHQAPFAHRVLDFEAARWSTPGVVAITNRKLVASYYIDDRAIPFRTREPGEWLHILNGLRRGSYAHDHQK